MNVLIMSISQKVPLIMAIKKALNRVEPSSKIFGADANDDIVGRFFVDEFWKIPPLSQLTIEHILTYCEINQIKAIIPTRDGELTFFSTHLSLFEEHRISVLVSPLNTIKACLDKKSFYEFGAMNQFPVIPTVEKLSEVEGNRLVVKNRIGSGSKQMMIDITKEQAKKQANSDVIFQPYIEGNEYSIDVYISKKKELIGAIVRKRELIVNGESQITTTCKHDNLERIITEFALSLGLYGHAVFQAIETKEQQLAIIECNPRFGGASTLSIASGLDSFYWFLLESLGNNLEKDVFMRAKEERKLIRHAHDLII
ncbi:hypothetical protein BTS2_2579 [Bacillus sp. TS-2]|nr:hypothetical protein BTS2_2579 [Bacillus sp. TS-2]